MKKYVKHSLTFLVIVVLLISLNLNAFCAPASVTFNLYEFKNFITPSLNLKEYTYMDKHCTRIQVPTTASSMVLSSYYKVPDGLTIGSSYTVNFSVNRSTGDTLFRLLLIDKVDGSSSDKNFPIVDAVEIKNNTGRWVDYSFQFKYPEMFNGIPCYLVFQTLSSKSVSTVFYISDIVFTDNSPFSGNINTPDTSDFNNSLDQLEQFENDLPQIDKEQFNSLFNFDFSRFTSSMAFIRNMFDRTVEALNFDAVLLFALAIGLATYIIGKKVK